MYSFYVSQLYQLLQEKLSSSFEPYSSSGPIEFNMFYALTTFWVQYVLFISLKTTSWVQHYYVVHWTCLTLTILLNFKNHKEMDRWICDLSNFWTTLSSTTTTTSLFWKTFRESTRRTRPKIRIHSFWQNQISLEEIKSRKSSTRKLVIQVGEPKAM